MAGPKKINSALNEKSDAGLGAPQRGRPPHDDRPYVEAMLWVLRTGSPWRDLPPRFPKWRSVYTRWRRWVRAKLWARVFAALATDHDPETYAVDAATTPTGGASGSPPPATSPSVPGRRSRLVQPAYDEHLYRARHLVENCFTRLKSAAAAPAQRGSNQVDRDECVRGGGQGVLRASRWQTCWRAFLSQQGVSAGSLHSGLPAQ